MPVQFWLRPLRVQQPKYIIMYPSALIKGEIILVGDHSGRAAELYMVCIVQLVRIFDCGSKGHQFESDYTPK